VEQLVEEREATKDIAMHGETASLKAISPIK
jgi:hypothetical protein